MNYMLLVIWEKEAQVNVCFVEHPQIGALATSCQDSSGTGDTFSDKKQESWAFLLQYGELGSCKMTLCRVGSHPEATAVVEVKSTEQSSSRRGGCCSIIVVTTWEAVSLCLVTRSQSWLCPQETDIGPVSK